MCSAQGLQGSITEPSCYFFAAGGTIMDGGGQNEGGHMLFVHSSRDYCLFLNTNICVVR
jgi:hypothetical protein